MVGEITGRVGEMTNMVGDLTQTINSHSQSIARLEAQVELIVDIISWEEEELQSQPVANPDEDYMVDESTSCHKQAITTMRSGEVVENHVEERKEEQFEAPQDLLWEKGKEVSTEASSPSPPIPEMPYEPRAPIPIHDSLPDEKLFENT
jgi:hypothetical protein